MLMLLLPVAGWAQLGESFETRKVVVQIDMPASQSGVDIYPQRNPPLELNHYRERIKRFGIALHAGDQVMVTKVLVKDKVIEFQLGGGGYGTFWDESGSVSANSVPKSNREKDLESRLRSTTNTEDRRRIERDLDYERRERERRESRERAIAQQATEDKQQRIANKRLDGGSRFNIRFENAIPAEAVTPELIRRALEQYISFTGDRGRTQQSAAPELEKGMSRSQVETKLGRAIEVAVKEQGGLQLTQCVYQTRDALIHVDFVNEVLVRYTIASR